MSKMTENKKYPEFKTLITAMILARALAYRQVQPKHVNHQMRNFKGFVFITGLRVVIATSLLSFIPFIFSIRHNNTLESMMY